MIFRKVKDSQKFCALKGRRYTPAIARRVYISIRKMKDINDSVAIMYTYRIVVRARKLLTKYENLVQRKQRRETWLHSSRNVYRSTIYEHYRYRNVRATTMENILSQTGSSFSRNLYF